MNKAILKLAVPNIISHITVPLLGIIDMSLMGHLGNQNYLGAVALGNQAISFLFWNFAFLRMSTAGITAQHLGAKQYTEIILSLARALSVAVLSALLLISLKNPLSFLAFDVILSGNAEVEHLAKEYFAIRIMAGPAAVGKFVFFGWFIGMQNSVIPMVVEVLVNIINITFNFFFVYAMGLHSDGVAYATVIAQYAGIVLCFAFFMVRYRQYLAFLNIKSLWVLAAIKRFFKVNTDIFLRTFCVILVLSFIIVDASKKGTTTLNVNTILREFLFIFSFFLDGFAVAGEALVGRYTGEKNKQLLKKCIKHLMVFGAVFGILFTLIYAFGGNFIVRLFTNKPEEINMAMKYIPWVIALPVLSFVTFTWDGVFIGATYTRQMLVAMLIATFGVFFPVYLLTHNLIGNHGIFLAFVLFFFSRGIVQSIQAKKIIYNT